LELLLIVLIVLFMAENASSAIWNVSEGRFLRSGYYTIITFIV
jgi:hypothetical protein